MYRSVPAVLAAVLLTGGLAAASAQATEASHRSVLRSGETLQVDRITPDAQRLTSQNGAFTVEVSAGSIQISEDEKEANGSSGGAVLWNRFVSNEKFRHDRSRLVMQRNGNLVLRLQSGRAAWSSKTSGAGNYAQLTDNGNLVVRSAQGHPLWSTHTTPIIRVSGQRLGSGQTLVDRYREQFRVTPTYLSMTRSGDLTLRWGSRLMWHTRTHTTGSVFEVSAAGRFVVVAPNGHVVWHAPLAAGTRASLFVDECGEVTFEQGVSSWSPAGSTRLC